MIRRIWDPFQGRILFSRKCAQIRETEIIDTLAIWDPFQGRILFSRKCAQNRETEIIDTGNLGSFSRENVVFEKMCSKKGNWNIGTLANYTKTYTSACHHYNHSWAHTGPNGAKPANGCQNVAAKHPTSWWPLSVLQLQLGEPWYWIQARSN